MLSAKIKLSRKQRERLMYNRKIYIPNHITNNNTYYITGELCGGLGNQLFQIFNIIAYATKYNRKFYLPHYKGMLGIDKQSVRPSYWENILQYAKPFIKDITHYQPIHENKTQCYTELPPPPNKHIKLIGYFQSPLYFDSYKEDIIHVLQLRSFRKAIQDQYNFENSISMHFRIGDYKSNTNYHYILPLSYYHDSIQYILQKSNSDVKWTIHYCCEDMDIDQVSKHISILQTSFPDLQFIRVSPTLQDWEQLLYMSCCTHNIIANSTFSWWGAYLNSSIVCYPSKWFGVTGTRYSIDNLFLKEWTKIM
jgi:hypothetical protein